MRALRGDGGGGGSGGGAALGSGGGGGGGGGGDSLHKCQGCHKGDPAAEAARYCGRECQAAHWPVHRLVCPGRRQRQPAAAAAASASAAGRPLEEEEEEEGAAAASRGASVDRQAKVSSRRLPV